MVGRSARIHHDGGRQPPTVKVSRGSVCRRGFGSLLVRSQARIRCLGTPLEYQSSRYAASSSSCGGGAGRNSRPLDWRGWRITPPAREKSTPWDSTNDLCRKPPSYQRIPIGTGTTGCQATLGAGKGPSKRVVATLPHRPPHKQR